jgi:hypothetical protein
MPHAAIVVAGETNTVGKDPTYLNDRTGAIASAESFSDLGDALDVTIEAGLLDTLDTFLPQAIVKAVLGAISAAAASSFAVQVGWFESSAFSVEIGSSESDGEGLVSIVLRSPILRPES